MSVLAAIVSLVVVGGFSFVAGYVTARGWWSDFFPKGKR